VHVASRLFGNRRPIQSPRIHVKIEEPTNSIEASHGDRLLGGGRMYDIDSDDDEGSDMRLLPSSASGT
jgi:hypothetical protein